MTGRIICGVRQCELTWNKVLNENVFPHLFLHFTLYRFTVSHFHTYD